MIPILYDKYETGFLSNGLGQLGDCLSCTVTEEVNGIYECEFQYPMTGAYYEMLINCGGVIACTHDHNGDVQLFDIYKYDAPIDGVVTFYAAHVSYRLSSVMGLNGWVTVRVDIPPYWYTSVPACPSELFAVWNDKSAGTMPHDFTFTDHSGYSRATVNGQYRYFYPGRPYSIRGVMLGTDDSTNYEEKDYGGTNRKGWANGQILKLWPGEWKFDNFNVDFYKNRGTDRGIEIRYGKNMTSVQRDRDQGGIISGVVPMWISSDGNSEYSSDNDPESVFRYQGFIVFSPQTSATLSQWDDANTGEPMTSGGETLFFRPPIIRIQPVDFTANFSTRPTETQLKNAALDYMSKNSTWRADDNITVEFLDLYGTPEYAGIEGLSNCLCGDYVSILYPRLGIVSNGVEIMSLTYDVLAERVTQMQLNTIRTTLAQVIIDSIGGK